MVCTTNTASRRSTVKQQERHSSFLLWLFVALILSEILLSRLLSCTFYLCVHKVCGEVAGALCFSAKIARRRGVRVRGGGTAGSTYRNSSKTSFFVVRPIVLLCSSVFRPAKKVFVAGRRCCMGWRRAYILVLSRWLLDSRRVVAGASFCAVTSVLAWSLVLFLFRRRCRPANWTFRRLLALGVSDLG